MTERQIGEKAKKKQDDGFYHCPDCNGLMTTYTKDADMCSACGHFFKKGRSK